MMNSFAYRCTRDGLIIVAVAWAAWNTHVVNDNRATTAHVAHTAAMSAAQTHNALCALRGDLATRVASSRAFLVTHPKGFAGISAAVIQQGIDNEQRTIDTLRFLRCGKAQP